MSTITNREIGERIGLSVASVSRLRSGERTPSLDVMVLIEKEYGFTVQQQVDAREIDRGRDGNPAYAQALTRAIEQDATERELAGLPAAQ